MELFSVVDVKVEVASNRSFEGLDLTKCEQYQALFMESNILACVGGIRWTDVANMDYFKPIVSCV